MGVEHRGALLMVNGGVALLLDVVKRGENSPEAVMAFVGLHGVHCSFLKKRFFWL